MAITDVFSAPSQPVPPHKIHFGFSVFFHKASSQASLPSFKMRLRSEEALNVTEGPSQMSVV